jgi:hypothetical protein
MFSSDFSYTSFSAWTEDIADSVWILLLSDLVKRFGCLLWFAKNGVVPVASDSLLLYAICAMGSSET